MQKFEVGQSYATRSICDYDCVFRFTITKRTERTVWSEHLGKVKARRIRVWDGAECIDPLGRYSMAPVLTAADRNKC